MKPLTISQRLALNRLPAKDQRVWARRTAGQDPAVPLTVPVATNWKEALMRIVNQEQVRSRKLTEQRTRPVAGGAAPELLDFLWLFYKRMDGRGIPVYAHTIVRTPEQQLQEFLDGDSRDDPRDGLYPHKGTAVDIIHSIYAWDMSEYEWLIFGEVGKELAIQRGLDMVWGGDWIKKGSNAKVGWDPAHWELRDWRKLCAKYPWKETLDGRYNSR